MKSLIVIFSLLFSSMILADSKEIFSDLQRIEIIEIIDNTCADTWCEGDYNFKFTDFSCDKTLHTCDLKFYFINTDDNDAETYSSLQVCHFEKITKFKQIKQSKHSLNNNFYGELTDCISDLESELQF